MEPGCQGAEKALEELIKKENEEREEKSARRSRCSTRACSRRSRSPRRKPSSPPRSCSAASRGEAEEKRRSRQRQTPPRRAVAGENAGSRIRPLNDNEARMRKTSANPRAAKKYNVTNDELIALLKNAGYEVGNPNSAVDYDMLTALDRHFSWASAAGKKTRPNRPRGLPRRRPRRPPTRPRRVSCAGKGQGRARHRHHDRPKVKLAKAASLPRRPSRPHPSPRLKQARG
jgi:hypothetical protein